MTRVLNDDQEHEMVRHEAAEALGGVLEEADDDAAQTQAIETLKRWAEDQQAPRVVRESCVVALDEMACTLNDKANGQTTTTRRSSSRWIRLLPKRKPVAMQP